MSEQDLYSNTTMAAKLFSITEKSIQELTQNVDEAEDEVILALVDDQLVGSPLVLGKHADMDSFWTFSMLA
jgi:hypothetical protein